MPCCAFAAFIVGQILLGLNAIKRFFFGASSIVDAPDNPATQWRLFAADSTTIAAGATLRHRLGLRWIALAAAVEIALMTGGAYALRAHLAHHAVHHLRHHHEMKLAQSR
jgi:hypothetical protein